MAIRKYVLNEDQQLTEEQTRMVREAAKRPVVVDDDNPELTDEQLSFFHRVQRAGMNPKTLQYLMGHSDIGVTLNVYTHLGLEDAAAEMARMEAVETARKEQEKISGKRERENTVTQKMFRAF